MWRSDNAKWNWEDRVARLALRGVVLFLLALLLVDSMGDWPWPGRLLVAALIGLELLLVIIWRVKDERAVTECLEWARRNWEGEPMGEQRGRGESAAGES